MAALLATACVAGVMWAFGLLDTPEPIAVGFWRWVMQDAKGRSLQRGDFVMIPCRVRDFKATGRVELNPISNVPVPQSIDHVYAPQVLRANPGDSLDYVICEDNGQTFLR